MHHPFSTNLSARFPKLLAIGGASLLLLVFVSSSQGRWSISREPAELQHFSYEVVEFDAPSLASSKGECGVYLPRGYPASGARPLPWIIWLHGMNEDGGRFHDGGGAAVLDRLRGEGEIPELIVFTPTAPRRTIYANGEQAGEIEDFILRDLVEFIEQNYPVATDRSQRAIMGVSMGGMGALRMALRHPTRFGTVAVHSAAALPPDPTVLEAEASERVNRSIRWLGLGSLLGDPIDPERWAAFVPSAMVGDLTPEELDGLRIYFDAGTADRYGFGPPNRQFHELLAAREIEHSFTLVQGGGHSWRSGTIQKQLVDSLRFVAVGFEAKSAATKPAVDECG